MSLENSHVNSIRRYLLGDLSEQERADIEERLMSDDNLYQELLFAEDDLIDEYLFDKLPEEDRPKFKQRFLHVPELRQNVAFTAALRKHARKQPPQVVAAVQQESVPAPRPVSIFDWFKGLFMQPAFGGALATVLIAAVALNVWLVNRNSRLTNRIAQLEAQQTSPQQQLDAALKRNEELSQTVAQQQQLLEEESRKVQALEQRNIPSPPTDKPAAGIFAVALTSGLVREADPRDRTTKISVPRDKQTVRFKLDVAPGDYRSYSAILETGDGKRKWSRQGLQFTKGNFVPFDVPVTVVTPDDYCVVLSGAKSSKAQDEIGRYCFRVVN
jgi:uncharacterized coiled-coil protein SlyX